MLRARQRRRLHGQRAHDVRRRGARCKVILSGTHSGARQNVKKKIVLFKKKMGSCGVTNVFDVVCDLCIVSR